ncbi:MAG TPA: hypothetical protein VF310_14240 [Vicinamibacteria bacterium]
MALRLVRALLAAHLQATFNRSRQELGQQGQVAVIVLVVLSAVSLLPALPAAAVGGYFTARGLPQRWAVYVIGGVLGVVPLLVGITGAVFGGSRRLAWESYRIFPVRTGPLFAAELLAGLGDVWSLLYLAGGGAFALGLCLRRPLLSPLVLLLLVLSLAWMAATELLVGSLGAALVRRLRWVLMSLGLLLWMASVLGAPAAEQLKGRRLDEAGRARALAVLSALARAWEWVPSTHAARGRARGAEGDIAGALARQAYPLGLTALLLGAAYLRLIRETEPARQAGRLDAPARAQRGWTFRSPTEGVARLHWDLLTRSHLGRFLFLFPLITVVLLKGPFAHMPGVATWGVPMAFAYLSLSGANLQFNQFGLDGPGVKALLLLPITGRALLVGKAGALAAHQAIQAVTLVVLLAFLLDPAPALLVAGVLGAASLFVLQVGVGHWVSIWQPRRVPLDKMRNTNLPFTAALVQLGVTSVGVALLAPVWLVLLRLAPGLLVPAQAVILAVVVAVYLAALPGAGRFLEGRSEWLVQRLE